MLSLLLCKYKAQSISQQLKTSMLGFLRVKWDVSGYHFPRGGTRGRGGGTQPIAQP